MVIPITLLYFTFDRGFSAVSVGVGLSIAGIAGTVATPISGVLIDRFGPRYVGASVHLVSAGAFMAYLLVGSYWEFLVVVILSQTCERMFRPAKTSLAAALANGGDRVRLLAIHRALRNVGYGIGGGVAAVALAIGSNEAYVVLIVGNALSYLITATLLSRLKVEDEPILSASPEDKVGYMTVLRNRHYMALSGLNMLFLLHSSVLQIGLPLWIVRETNAPAALAAALFTFNTVVVVGLQVWAAQISEGVDAAARAYLLSGVALVGSCAAFAAASAVGTVTAIVVLVMAVFLLSVGEVLATVGEWGVSIGLAPERGQGRYLAVFSTGSAAQLVFGPLLITALIVNLSALTWAVFASIFFLSALATWFVAHEATSGPYQSTVRVRST
jgi:MFS family permease